MPLSQTFSFLPKQEDNAFLRVLHLPMVNSACVSLQKTYAITKEAHPLMASVCQAYERGIQSATSLAVWSVKPVVQMLEPQCACFRKDRGEELGEALLVS